MSQYSHIIIVSNVDTKLACDINSSLNHMNKYCISVSKYSYRKSTFCPHTKITKESYLPAILLFVTHIHKMFSRPSARYW